MGTPGPASPPRRPWEPHALVCLFLLALGLVLKPDDVEEVHLAGIAGVTVCMIGLFRRNHVAWWATTFAFALMMVLAAWGSIELASRYGFRAHRLLLQAHAQTAFWAVAFGLLLSFRIRGALAVPVEPLWEDLPSFRRVVIVFAPVLFILAALFSLTTIAFVATRRYSGERYASTTLKTISTAEADFRANDRDWNHVNDFWTRDIGGLWGIVPSNEKEPIKLIELSAAAADSDPVKGAYPSVPAEPSPKAGAWFVGLIEDRSEVPPLRYRDPEVRTSRFGFLCFPDDYIGGFKYAFILNENNTIFRRALTGDIRPTGNTPPGPMKDPGFANWPSDGELKANWPKPD
jgi:hypothetical protein